MRNFRKYILYFLLGLMITSAGLNWQIPFINSVKTQDKTIAVDKSEELNSLTIQRNRNFTKVYEITNAKSKFFKFSTLISTSPLKSFQLYDFHITFRCAIDSYLHLLQLY